MKNWNFLQAKRLTLIDSFDTGLYLLIRYILYGLGVISLLVVLAGLTSIFAVPAALLSAAYFMLSPALLMVSITIYVSYLRTHPEYSIGPKEIATNPLNSFDFTALRLLRVLAGSKTWQQFWQVAAKNGQETEIIYRLGFTPAELSSLHDATITKQDVEAIIAACVTVAEGSRVSVFHLLRVLLEIPEIKAVLTKEKLQEKDITDLLLFYDGLEAAHRAVRQTRERTGGIAKDWAVSYTNLTDAVTTTLSVKTAEEINQFSPIFSRQKIIDNIVVAMQKAAGQNILLEGAAGVGKTELFYHFAAKVLLYQTKTELDGKDVRLLDVNRLLSLSKTPGELEQVMGSLFGELGRAGNIILFIDQIDTLLEPSGKLGTVDIGNLLQGYLTSTNINIISTISTDSYLKLVKPSALLSQQFTTVSVPAPDPSELLGILLSHVRSIEGRYNVFFLLESLTELCQLASRYIKDSESPSRELTLLEQVAAAAHTKNTVLITPKDVMAAVETEVDVPLQVDEQAKNTLLNLEAELHTRVIGQNTAIKEISDALLRARAGLSTATKPIGSFLFLGPTGVGKTETAKALAAIYFGSQKKLIRLDMSEYADSSSLQKLLGTDLVKDPGSLTLAVQQSPSAVVLFDEIEKSNNLVTNALLQLLDEGRITTNYGKVLDFTNTIVIATSNAGSEYIRSQIQQGSTVAAFEKPLIDQLITQKIFATEFLNRFDGVIVYTPLSKPEIRQIVQLQLTQLGTKLQQEKGIALTVAPAVVDELVTTGYDPVFGARALERVLKEKLETAIAKQIISQNLQPGSSLTINQLG